MSMLIAPSRFGTTSGPGDSDWASVISLLHFDTVGATSFADAKAPNWSQYGNAIVSSTQSQFGGGSLYLDGSSGAVSNFASNASITGDFSIEFWIYRTRTITQEILFDGRQNSSSPGMLSLQNGYFAFSNSLAWYKFSTIVPINTWTFLQCIRTGSNVVLAMNGNSETVVAVTSALPIYASSVIGMTNSAHSAGFAGYIDDFRLSSIARSVGVPTTPFPDHA